MTDNKFNELIRVALDAKSVYYRLLNEAYSEIDERYGLDACENSGWVDKHLSTPNLSGVDKALLYTLLITII